MRAPAAGPWEHRRHLWRRAPGGTPAAKGSPEAAERFLRDILKRVSIMDLGARESMLTFEKGAGGRGHHLRKRGSRGAEGGKPSITSFPVHDPHREPVAVVDVYAKAHKNEDLANAFVEFLYTPEVQRAFGVHGLRPVNETVAREIEPGLPKPTDLFTIRDLGGWPKVTEILFSAGGYTTGSRRPSERSNASIERCFFAGLGAPAVGCAGVRGCAHGSATGCFSPPRAEGRDLGALGSREFPVATSAWSSRSGRRWSLPWGML